MSCAEPVYSEQGTLLLEPVGPNCSRWLPRPLREDRGRPADSADRLDWAAWYSECQTSSCVCGVFAELLCSLVERDLSQTQRPDISSERRTVAGRPAGYFG